MPSEQFTLGPLTEPTLSADFVNIFQTKVQGCFQGLHKNMEKFEHVM